MSSTIHFREFEPEDAIYCQFIRRASLIHECSSESPGLELWKSAAEVPPENFRDLLRTSKVFVAVCDDYVCGFCALQVHCAVVAEIAFLYIKPDMRDYALGSALLRYAEMALVVDQPQVEVFTATIATQNEYSWRAEGYCVTGTAVSDTSRSPSPTIRIRKYSTNRSEPSIAALGTAGCR